MQILILGAAAGGGFPQWNCACANCAGLRAGTLAARPQTQSSIAVSGDGEHFLLINASPDIRQQINATPALQPARGARDTGIGAVLLVDAQIDHTAGLLILREGERLPVYCTPPVHEDLTTGFPVLRMLEHYCGVDWQPLVADGTSFGVPQVPGISLQAFALSSKAPPYSPHRHDPHPGDNIGLLITDSGSGRKLFYAPGLGDIEPHLWAPMQAADCVLVDGTCWTDDELSRRGVGSKRSRQMGHLPQHGPGGMIEALERLPETRKILIHINNTNPILLEDGPERATLAAAGIEVAHDGMDIVL